MKPRKNCVKMKWVLVPTDVPSAPQRPCRKLHKGKGREGCVNTVFVFRNHQSLQVPGTWGLPVRPETSFPSFPKAYRLRICFEPALAVLGKHGSERVRLLRCRPGEGSVPLSDQGLPDQA